MKKCLTNDDRRWMTRRNFVVENEDSSSCTGHIKGDEDIVFRIDRTPDEGYRMTISDGEGQGYSQENSLEETFENLITHVEKEAKDKLALADKLKNKCVGGKTE